MAISKDAAEDIRWMINSSKAIKWERILVTFFCALSYGLTNAKRNDFCTPRCTQKFVHSDGLYIKRWKTATSTQCSCVGLIISLHWSPPKSVSHAKVYTESSHEALWKWERGGIGMRQWLNLGSVAGCSPCEWQRWRGGRWRQGDSKEKLSIEQHQSSNEAKSKLQCLFVKHLFFWNCGQSCYWNYY